MRHLAVLLVFLPVLALSAEEINRSGVVAAGAEAHLKQIVGRVSQIVDGDTFDLSGVLRGRIRDPRRIPSRYRIRLCGIKAPERGYLAAARHLGKIIDEQIVRCVPVGQGTPCDGRSKKQSRNRVVAQCFIKNEDIAGAMVNAGHARDWKRFSDGYYSR